MSGSRVDTAREKGSVIPTRFVPSVRLWTDRCVYFLQSIAGFPLCIWRRGLCMHFRKKKVDTGRRQKTPHGIVWSKVL